MSEQSMHRLVMVFSEEPNKAQRALIEQLVSTGGCFIRADESLADGPDVQIEVKGGVAEILTSLDWIGVEIIDLDGAYDEEAEMELNDSRHITEFLARPHFIGEDEEESE